MPIDHAANPDMPDMPNRPSETPPAPGEAETPPPSTARDFRQVQLTEHARYHAVVDAAYQPAAQDAWAKAVPELRATWEAHKQNYPERSQAPAYTATDGSWVGSGNRRLSPEQNAEASKCCADLRDEAHLVIRPAMERVEAADPNRKLVGLEHMLKGEDRLKEKIADYTRAPGVTARDALDMVPDAVRFTLKHEPERYAEGVLTDLNLLKSEGFELIKLKNLWHSDQYKGINSQWRCPGTGTRFEMQFHTNESLEAKELTHEAYERIRSRTASPPEQRELEDFQGRVNALIRTPPATDQIKDFPEASDG